MADLASFISSATATLGFARAVIDARDSGISAAVKAELTEKILATQAQLAEVLGTIIDKDQTIRVLGERVRELEAQRAEQQRYRLAKVGTVGEFFAYELRPAAELVERTDEPPHFLCQPCFDAGKKSVLRKHRASMVCPVCNVIAQVDPVSPVQRRVASSGVSTRDDW